MYDTSNMGTILEPKKFVNKIITCKTLYVFNQSWHEKKSVDMGCVETP
jgi:hypothetical protein